MRAIDYYELERYCIDRGLTCVPVEVIKSMADVEAEPVRYGHWILNDRLIKSPWARNCHCSECGFEPMEQGNFCPHCGTKMRKEDEDDKSRSHV